MFLNLNILLAVGILQMSPIHSDSCFAYLENDTLRVGNALIERSFVWNGGHLKTVSLSNRMTGKTLCTPRPSPDFLLGNMSQIGSDGILTVENVLEDRIHPAHLKATVSFSISGGKDTLRVKRVFRIFPDVPVISSKFFIKGSLPVASEEPLDRVDFPSRHWKMRVVQFHDVTDHNDNLVFCKEVFSFKKKTMPGNIVFARNTLDGSAYFLLKEAPCSGRDGTSEVFSFDLEEGKLTARGWGIDSTVVCRDNWIELYGTALGVYGDGELSPLVSLRQYLKASKLHRADQDEMIMLNTWGDRGRDVRINEAFCINELKKGHQLGITHFQLDDGWQKGRSPASALGKGSFANIWESSDYWSIDPEKFPRGLTPVVKLSRSLGIELGLWFNPSNPRNLGDWEKDANVVLDMYKKYGIRYFKIDGLKINTRLAEENLRKMFERIKEGSDGSVVINLDVTAGARPGYFFLGEYGNIFLENRYTDFGSYYPYRTLRNLWQLSHYIPPEKLQIEFLNKWRNLDKYPSGDCFAPSNYDFSYLFAITMAAQPLAWFEASNLPDEALSIAPLVNTYKKIMSEFHEGIILPIGNEPDGCSWTGFQSMSDNNSGFILFFREKTSGGQESVKTWLPEGVSFRFTHIAGDGGTFEIVTKKEGRVCITLDKQNSFALYRYEKSSQDQYPQ